MSEPKTGRPSSGKNSLQQVAEIVGIHINTVHRGEIRALRKIRDALDLETIRLIEDSLEEPQRAIRAGKWNGKQIVRMG